MSSSNHLSKELHDLIKQIGETRSKQEEDRIIINEQQKLKDSINAKGQSLKKQRENLIKAIYIDMLGHDSSFAHIHAVNMTQSKSLKMKRLGYLCCCLFLRDNSELLLLLVAALQKDLKGTIHEIVIALTALAKLINPTIATGVQEEVYKLLNHQTDLVRKKAIMVMQKLYILNPSSIPDYEDKMKRALCDKEPSVMGSTLNLYHTIIKQNPIQYKDLVSSFVMILKQIIDHKLQKEFDYHRMPAPWIQIKLLQILAMLGENDQAASEQIYEVLQTALKRADDTGVNIGHAITFQCVKTISTIYPNQNLLEIASNSVSKFLKSENNNLKYLGINALIQIVHVNPKYVIDHQVIVVDCLDSKDDTLRHETLDLLFKMTNSANIVTIIDKLLFFLKADYETYFKKDLVNKITSLSERFCPNQQWFINTMNMVFEHGSEFISNNILNNFLKLINENFNTEGENFGKFIVETYMKIITKPNLADVTIKMISWVFGEIGSIIYDNDQEQVNKLTEVLLTIITNDFEDQKTRCWILSALAKLSSCNAFSMSDQLAACLNYYSKSKDIEIAERSKDFINLYKYTAALRQSSQIVFDEKLSFLDKYVNDSLKKGAKSYDKSKSLKVAIGNQNVQEPEVYYKPKEQDQLTSLKPVGNDDVQVKFTGEKKWSLERGYQENKPENKSKPSIQSQSNVSIKTSQSISSEDFKSKAQNSNVAVFRQNNDKDKQEIQKSEYYVKQQQKIKEQEQQLKNEKMEYINNLFQGVTNLNLQQSTQVQNVRWQTAASSQQYQQPQSQQMQQLNNSVDLLNLNEKSSLGTKDKGIQFSPLVINIQEYEKFWEQLKIEQQKSFNSRIKTESEYKNFLKNLNFYAVDTINNEIVSSGKNTQTGNVILLYGVYNQSGKLDITVKANTQDDINQISNQIQTNYC